MVEKAIGLLINIEWKKFYREHESSETSPIGNSKELSGVGVKKPCCMNPTLKSCWGFKQGDNDTCLNLEVNGICKKAE
jgi:hypothetical protein